MKIKTEKMSFSEVMALPRAPHRRPARPSLFFRTLMRTVAIPDLAATHFRLEKLDMKDAEGEACLVLMNHSCFMDLGIASRVMYPKPYCIVCTSDGFVGKEWLMRRLGCIPTQKFVTDFTLLSDMQYALKELKTSVLMYPEASYSLDGTATPPPAMGAVLKKLNVPVVMIRTHGAFLRDPLYNNLQKRRVDVRASVKCLFSREELGAMTPNELDERLKREFTFDNFREQAEENIRINEDFRADGLERILYKCPHCLAEGETYGKGTGFECRACGKKYEMTPEGSMRALDGETEYPHIPDWYAWERGCVKDEISSGGYHMESDVDIGVLVDYNALYMVGEGRLVHDLNGFRLTGCGGELDYAQKPSASYGLYADYFWYEIGDVICIGNRDALYYCFPKEKRPVAKARIASEELFRAARGKRLPTAPAGEEGAGKM